MAGEQQSLDVLRRVQGEYIEMPGLRLTIAQAQRLWGLDRAVCVTRFWARSLRRNFCSAREMERSCDLTTRSVFESGV
jgi:hypothetical protein